MLAVEVLCRVPVKGGDTILALVDNDTKIIPGHGPVGDKAQLENYRAMLSIAYERLQKLKAEGETAQEAAAAKPLEDLEAIWGNVVFLRVIVGLR